MSAAPDARVALRSRGVLESTDLALRFVMENMRPFVRMSALVVLPGFALTLALRYAAGLDWWIVWCIALALATVLEGPFTVLLGQLALGSDAGVRDALRGFARRLGPFCVVLLGTFVALIAGAALLVAPVVFVAFATVFVPEVTLLEGAGLGAFRRAFKITTAFAGRAFGVVGLLFFGRLAAIALTDIVLRGTLGVVLDLRIHAESVWDDGGSPYALAGLWLSVPLCAAVRYFQYIDLRTIKEGWDLQRRFQLLAGRLRQEAVR